MYYRLADRTKIAEVNGKAFLVDDSLQELEGCTGKGLEALRRLATGCTRLDLEQSLGPEETDDLLRALDEAGLLRTTPLTVPVQEIFAKQLYYLDDLVNDPDAAHDLEDRSYRKLTNCLIEAQSGDAVTRRTAFSRADSLLRRVLPAIPLCSGQSIYLCKPEVRGYRVFPDGSVSFQGLRFELGGNHLEEDRQ